MSRYLLSGYYGFGNAGDEAILQAIVSDLRSQDAEARITVLSADPTRTAAEHQVQAVLRTNLSQVSRAMRATGLFISGGGGLLQDVTSKRSLLYYLALIKLAAWLGKPVMVYANSLGPIRQPFNRRLTASVLSRVPCITVRDSGSRRFLDDLGVVKPRIEETADPVLLLSGPQVAVDRRLITFAIREWPSEHDYVAEVAQAARQLQAEGYQTQFVPLHHARDRELAERLAAATPGAGCLSEPLTVEQLLTVIAQSGVVVGMRLHALIMAAICLRPMVGIGYDPKVTSFLQDLGQPLAGMANDLQATQLLRQVRQVAEQSAAVVADLQARLPELRARARRNSELAVALARGRRP